MNKIEQIKELKILFDSGVLDNEQYTKLLNEIIETTENNSNFIHNSGLEDENFHMNSNQKIDDYKSVKIGNQEWMTENLNVKTFRNGDVIYEASDCYDWLEAIKSKTPAWCYYDDDPIYAEKKGLLYNFYAVHDPRGLAPLGWQVPSYEDFQDLLQNSDDRAIKSREDWYYRELILMEDDTDDEINIIQKTGIYDQYYKININAGENGTNKSGFNLKPSGYFDVRDNKGSFYDIDIASVLWVYNNNNKFICAHDVYPYRYPHIGNSFILNKNYSWKKFNFNNDSGYALRCIKKEDYLIPIDYSNISINRDPVFNEAAQIIIDSQQGLSSLLQRKLKIGYERSKKLMNQLEAAGIVGPENNNSRMRQVLITDFAKVFEIDNGSIASLNKMRPIQIINKSENAIEVKLSDNGLTLINWLTSIGQEISFLDSLFSFEIDGIETEEVQELYMCDVLSILEMDNFTTFKGILTNIYLEEGDNYIPNTVICIIEPDASVLEEYKLLKKN
jgi:uncharacterized protein (TIGR02145 family)